MGGRRWWTLRFSGRRGHLTGGDSLALGWGGMPRQKPPSSPGSRVLGAPFWQLRGCSPRSRGYSGVAAAPSAAPGSAGGEGRKGRSRSWVCGWYEAVRLPFPKRSPAASSFGACGSPSPPAELLRALRWPGSRPNRSLRRSPPSSPSAGVLPQQLGGRERPPAAAGRRLGAASRARGAAIWSLGSGRGCGSKGRGLAARPEAQEVQGSERGSGACSAPMPECAW